MSSGENQTVSINVTGSFYVGDICYCLQEDVYHKVWGEANKYSDGAFTDPKTGYQFATVSTAYGDGVYFDGDMHAFPVDAGNIGIVDMKLSKISAESLMEDCGQVFEYTGKVSITYDEGTITIDFADKQIVIETADY